MAYLGETPVDLSTDENFKHYTPTDWVMYYIGRYSGIDGDHHQKWLVEASGAPERKRIRLGTTAGLICWKVTGNEYSQHGHDGQVTAVN
jgi:hypothetical protein